MSELLSIIYVSSALRAFSNDELEVLLVEARAFNKANAITGVLLYVEGNFMQCLEGPADSVLRAYDRILASKLHKGLIELNRSKIENRSFESWEMGLLRPTNTEFISISKAVSLAAPNGQSSLMAIEFMKSFISTMGAAR